MIAGSQDTSMGECMPSRSKVLGSMPSTTKQKMSLGAVLRQSYIEQTSKICQKEDKVLCFLSFKSLTESTIGHLSSLSSLSLMISNIFCMYKYRVIQSTGKHWAS